MAEHLQYQYLMAISARDEAELSGDEEEFEKWQALGDSIQLRLRDLKSFGEKDFPFIHSFYWGGFVSHGLA